MRKCVINIFVFFFLNGQKWCHIPSKMETMEKNNNNIAYHHMSSLIKVYKAWRALLTFIKIKKKKKKNQLVGL